MAKGVSNGTRRGKGKKIMNSNLEMRNAITSNVRVPEQTINLQSGMIPLTCFSQCQSRLFEHHCEDIIGCLRRHQIHFKASNERNEMSDKIDD